MNTILRLAAVAMGVIFFSTIYTSAQDLTIPHTFSADTPAVAAQVNANFNAIKTEVDNNNTRITNNADAIGSLESLIVAYGKIKFDATIYSGSNISSCEWNASLNRYEIEISGESYFYTDYVTVITPTTQKLTCNTNSMSGKLLVYFFDSSGTEVQTTFSFLTLKP